MGRRRSQETIRLCKMNLAVHGLAGDVRQGNTYYEDIHRSVGKFDFVMANPPFNVDKVDKERLKADPRYPFGLPKADNGNYLWIEDFYSALNTTGRAGFVMANSAGDARGSEMEIRRKLPGEDRRSGRTVMISIGPNFFYTVTLPCTHSGFLDRGKKNTNRKTKCSSSNARHIFRQIDRAHREFTPEQIEFIANIVRLYRGEADGNRWWQQADLMKRVVSPAGSTPISPVCVKWRRSPRLEAQGWSSKSWPPCWRGGTGG